MGRQTFAQNTDPDPFIRTFAVSKDGQWLVIIKLSGTVEFVDRLNNHRLVQSMLKGMTIPTSVAINPLDGSQSVIGMSDGGLYFFKITDNAISSIEVTSSLRGGIKTIQALDWSSDGQRIAIVGSWDATEDATVINIWDISRQDVTHIYTNSDERSTTALWNPQYPTELLMTFRTEENGSHFMLWRPIDNVIKWDFHIPGPAIYRVVWSPDGTELANMELKPGTTMAHLVVRRYSDGQIDRTSAPLLKLSMWTEWLPGDYIVTLGDGIALWNPETLAFVYRHKVEGVYELERDQQGTLFYTNEDQTAIESWKPPSRSVSISLEE